MTLLIVLLALSLDILLGEPRRAHPLVAFGRYAQWLEGRFNPLSSDQGRIRGLVAVVLATAPFVCIAVWLAEVLRDQPVLMVVLSSIILYVAIGWQSLLQHARAVVEPLQHENIDRAQEAVALLVSRDVTALDAEGVAKAATESVLENGADALFSALFWFLVAGVPGVVLYRLVNTLDAMWGYRNERFEHFGWAAARFDDVLNYIPARLTALGYSLAGNTYQAMMCWHTQGRNWKSPNAGPVMSSGAGALGVTLGGEARYARQHQVRPLLGLPKGQGVTASADTVLAACRLVNRALVIWVLLIGVGSVVL